MGNYIFTTTATATATATTQQKILLLCSIVATTNILLYLYFCSLKAKLSIKNIQPLDFSVTITISCNLSYHGATRANAVYYTLSITNIQYKEGHIHRHSVCLTSCLAAMLLLMKILTAIPKEYFRGLNHFFAKILRGKWFLIVNS